METIEQAKLESLSHDQYDRFEAATDFIDRQLLEFQARQLIKDRESLPKVEVKRQERRDNARTTLMEALTASGHLSRVEIHGSLEEINNQVLNRLLNGWDESLPYHERQRRFAELCNELVIQRVHAMIQTGEKPQSMAVTEVSDYPIALPDDKATELGYRRSNLKGMVRSTHLRSNDDGSYTRIIEQVSHSNGTPASSFRFYKAAGLDLGADRLADVAVLRAPFLYDTDDYLEGVIEVVRRLDQQDPAPVLYGDTVDKWQKHVAYEELRQESARREAEIECYIDDLADLEEQLAQLKRSDKIGEAERLSVFKGEVDRILTAICTLEPAYAEDTFGKKAAGRFAEAGQLYASGHGDLARQAMQEAQYLKEAVTFCGMSISVEQAQKEGLKVNSYLALMEKGRQNWKWKKGQCQVKECPTRPAKTEVGPCSVCRKCQKIFDKGDKPQRVYRTLSFLDWLFGSNQKNT